MDKRGWLQRMTLAFPSQVAGGELAQFVVHQRSKLLKGPDFALRPFRQKPSDLVSLLKFHGRLLLDPDVPHYIPADLLSYFTAPSKQQNPMIGLGANFRMNR